MASSMRRRDDCVSRTQMEMALLQFLCSTKNNGAARHKLLQILAPYAWSTHDNIVLFECISELCNRVPRNVFEDLPAELARRGFPDMPHEILAAPARLRPASALALAQELLRLCKTDK